MERFTPTFINSYDPLKAGSIDSTDEIPHDKGIARAMNAKYKPNKHLPGEPECTVFVARFGPNTTERTLRKAFKQFGEVENVKIIRDVVSGYSKCYGFVEMGDSYQAREAIRSGHKMIVDDHEILVDSEKGRTLKGWIPRRLGGGLGGKRESGQLRFGGRDRPFSRPLVCNNSSSVKPEGHSQSLREEHGNRSSYSERRRNRSRDRHRSRSKSRDRNRKYRD